MVATLESLEQYMMYEKARLFGDLASMKRILGPEGRNPRTAKTLGREIKGFDVETWLVEQGNYLKYSQNPDLTELLLSTGSKELVEAFPHDRIWGIGFGSNNAGTHVEEWGMNLLGKVLMRVRSRSRAEGEDEEVLLL